MNTADTAGRVAGRPGSGPGLVIRLVQGFFSGLLLGLGIALMLITYAKIAAGTKAPWVVVGIVTLIGTALGLLASRSNRS